MSVRSKLVFVMLLAALLPLWLTDLIIIGLAERTLEANVLDNLRQIARAGEAHLQTYLDGKRNRSLDFASDGRIRQSLHDYQRGIWSHDDRARLETFLKTGKQPLDPELLDITLVSTQGQIVASTAAVSPRDLSQRPFFQRGARVAYLRERPLWGEAERREEVLLVAAPVRDPSGGPAMGILLNRFRLTGLANAVGGESHPGAGAQGRPRKPALYLVGSDGLPLTPYPAAGEPSADAPVIATLPVRNCQQRGRGDSGVWTDPLGRRVWGAAACLSVEGRRWTLLVEQTAEVALAPVQALRTLNYSVLAAAVLAAAVAAWWLAAGIARPVETLRRGIDAVAAGRLDGRVGTSARDEIGALSRAFDRMTVRLREVMASRDELNREVAERRRVEQALRDSETRFRAVFDQAGIGIAMVDMQGRPMASNLKLQQMLGYSGEELRAMPFTRFTRPDYADMDLEQYRELVAGRRELYRMEKIYIRKDGGEIWGGLTVTLVRDERGRPAFAVGMVEDISQRKAAEAARERSERLFSRLVSVSPDAIAVHRGGRYVYINQAGVELFGGRGPEDIAGRTVLDLIHPGDREFVSRRIRTVLESGATPLNAVRILRLDGAVTHVEARGTVVDHEGQSAVLVIMRDVTRRKLAEERLRVTAEALERSNRELQQFAYVASHDLQEPLRMVSSYLQLLKRRYQNRLDADADEFIGYAVDGAERMKRLIESLLEYSRIQSRAGPPQPVALGQVLETVLHTLALSLEEQGAEVSHTELPTVLADPVQVEQLLRNLIGNAVKFHGGARPRAQVGAMPLADYRGDLPQSGLRDGWLLWVKDNGIGIAPEHRERIFAIFQRLHSRDEYPGTGIGLAICQRIVEQQGGRIWVESEPGAGATFYFTLPDGGRALNGGAAA